MFKEVKNAPPEGESYLPSWILDMRKNLEKSKTASTYATQQINGILHDVAGLTTKLQEASEATKLHHQEMNDLTDDRMAGRGEMNVLDLPDDTLCVILQFLTIADVINMESTRKEVRLMIESSHYWLCTFSEQFKRFQGSGQTNFRDFVVRREQCVSSALTFIRVIKEKRSVPRFRNIEPHRYHRSDSGVSHPFPVVESEVDKREGHVEQSVGNTMMSRVETMNTDFRTFALMSMQDIADVTSYEGDAIHLKLVQCGTIAVLVSLLSSESDVLRQYSCESLANLLCWETRLILNYERFSFLNHVALSESKSLLGSTGELMANTPLSHRALREQLQVCDARRQLSSLLTSPSACVNLAQSRARGRDVNAPVQVTTCPHEAMTSAVQGVASKAACRVLVNLFSASDCVPSPRRDLVMLGQHASSETLGNGSAALDNCEGNHSAPIGALGAGQTTRDTFRTLQRDTLKKPLASPKTSPHKSKSAVVRKHCRVPESTKKTSFCVPSKPWKFTYYHRSGFVKDTHLAWLQLLGEAAGDSGVKSSERELRGRGEDDTGLFFLKGRVNIDMEGHSLRIEKCYIKDPMPTGQSASLHSQSAVVEPPPDMLTESNLDVRGRTAGDMSREKWCQNESGEWINWDEIAEWGRPHVSHTAYLSEAVASSVRTDAFVRNQKAAALGNLRHSERSLTSPGARAERRSPREDWSFYEHRHPSVLASRDSPGAVNGALRRKKKETGQENCDYVRFNAGWGGGLYGVWEASTTEAHFELVKGGVFRASPI